MFRLAYPSRAGVDLHWWTLAASRALDGGGKPDPRSIRQNYVISFKGFSETKQLGFYDERPAEVLETARREATLKPRPWWGLGTEWGPFELHRRGSRFSR